MSIKTRLILAFGIFILIISGTIVLQQIVANKANIRYEKLRLEIQPAVKAIDEYVQVNNFLKLLLKEKTNISTGYDIILNDKINTIVDIEIPNLIRVFNEISSLSTSSGVNRDIVNVLSSTIEITKQVEIIKITLQSRKDYLNLKKTEKCLSIYTDNIKPISTSINRSLFHLQRKYNEANLEFQHDLQVDFAEISFLILLFGLIGIFIGFFIAIQTIRTIVKPINKLKESAAIIGHGNYNHQVEIEGNNELSDLGNSFNQMTVSLKESFEIIKIQKEEQEISNTIKSAKNILYESLKSELTIDDISRITLSFFMHFYNSSVGAFYLVTDDQTLKCKVLVCPNRNAFEISEIPLGNSDLGEVALNNEVLLISDLHHNYSDSESAFGGFTTDLILLIPVQFSNECIAVIELPILKNPTELEFNFIKEVNDSIGLAIIAAENLKDIAEAHKRLEEYSNELVAKNKELEEFVYITSHDLQEPLRTITSYSEILEEDYNKVLDVEGMEYIKFLQKASERLRNQIDSLLQLSKIGKVADLEFVDFKELFSDIESELSFLLKEKNGKITFPEHSISGAKGALIELRLLFQNLIINGLKYNISDNPSIEISVVDNGKSITFCVADNGIGIDEKYYQKIFKIFQKLDNIEGTGIGLAHCKKIVEAHHGKIWVESELGEGSMFFFTIRK